MFETIIQSWFADYDSGYNDFVKALLSDDVKAMNVYMNRVAVTTFRFFDTGRKISVSHDPDSERRLEDTAKNALKQIDEKNMQRYWLQREFHRKRSESMGLHFVEKKYSLEKNKKVYFEWRH